MRSTIGCMVQKTVSHTNCELVVGHLGDFFSDRVGAKSRRTTNRIASKPLFSMRAGVHKPTRRGVQRVALARFLIAFLSSCKVVRVRGAQRVRARGVRVFERQTFATKNLHGGSPLCGGGTHLMRESTLVFDDQSYKSAFTNVLVSSSLSSGVAVCNACMRSNGPRLSGSRPWKLAILLRMASPRTLCPSLLGIPVGRSR